MTWTHRVAVQSPVKDELPSGQIVAGSWEDVDGMESVPATVVRAQEQFDLPNMTRDEELYDILLAGNRAVTTEMQIVDGDNAYEVTRVEPTLRHRATMVRARLVIAP